jgi:hypothetical protein
MDTTTSLSSDNKTSFKYGKLVLMFSTNYFENRLLPNDLISVRNHGDDDEDERDIKRVLERQGDAHIRLEIQYNSEFQSLTLSPIRSPGPAQFKLMYMTHTKSDLDVLYMHRKMMRYTFQWH